MDGLLHLQLQFKVEPDPWAPAAIALDPLPLFAVGAINLRIVCGLAGFDQTVIKLLAGYQCAGQPGRFFAIASERTT